LYTALPVGVPDSNGGVGMAKASALGGASSASGSVAVAKLQKELKEKEDTLTAVETKLEEQAVSYSYAGLLIESFLFPLPNSTTTTTTGDVTEDGTIPTSGEDDTTTNNPITEAHADPFIVMTQLDAWNYTLDYSNTTTTTTDTTTTKAADTTALVLKSCVVDLSLDYCTRLSTRLTNDYLNTLDTTLPVSYPTLDEMESAMEVIIQAAEPYCGIFGACYKADFRVGADGGAGGVTGVDNKCRPIDCPFGNVGACRYVASCLGEKVAAEYRVVIEKTLVEDGVTIGMVMEEGMVTDVVEEEEDVVGEEERKLYDSDLVEELVSSAEGGGGGYEWGIKR